jgi:hypothetical protein
VGSVPLRCSWFSPLDRLLVPKDALQQHLVARLGELIALDYYCCSMR